MTEKKETEISQEKFRLKLLTILFRSLSRCHEVKPEDSKEFFLSFTFPSIAHK